MTSIAPPNRPLQALGDTKNLISQYGIVGHVVLVGIRGYYLDTMGAPGKNDRGIYDDAMFIVSPSAYVTFNANTDPSLFKKRVASLKPGVWQYKKGNHTSPRSGASYPALRQSTPVTVYRDKENEQTGMFGINIHKGSYSGTSSLGCQTIYPAQWEGFIRLVYSEMNRYSQQEVPYLLIERGG